MESEQTLSTLAQQSAETTRRLQSALQEIQGEDAANEPTDRELDAAELAVRQYRKGRTRPRVREEMRRALKAARAVRP